MKPARKSYTKVGEQDAGSVPLSYNVKVKVKSKGF
jgi:hypothetical protein